jgi:ATP-dependent DNA helicase DinG
VERAERLLAAAVGAVPSGVDRPGQREMTGAVMSAIDSGEHLLVQAGTGTGKSLAYLVPALLQRGSPVVVSTATLALQSQLVEVDLPRLADAVEPLLGPASRC